MLFLRVFSSSSGRHSRFDNGNCNLHTERNLDGSMKWPVALGKNCLLLWRQREQGWCGGRDGCCLQDRIPGSLTKCQKLIIKRKAWNNQYKIVFVIYNDSFHRTIDF